MFQTKRIYISALFIIFSLSACSSKSPKVSDCGKNTLLQGATVGAVAGTLVSKLSGSSGIVGAIIGAALGGMGGAKLADMQCTYYGEEKELLKEISLHMQKQHTLAKATNDLNKKMTLLYHEINDLKNKEHLSNLEVETLYQKIMLREDAIYSLQKLNSNVRYDSKAYSKALQSSNFSKEDRISIEKSLKKIVKNLNKIEKASTYNLEQLQLFKARIS